MLINSQNRLLSAKIAENQITPFKKREASFVSFNSGKAITDHLNNTALANYNFHKINSKIKTTLISFKSNDLSRDINHTPDYNRKKEDAFWSRAQKLPDGAINGITEKQLGGLIDSDPLIVAKYLIVAGLVNENSQNFLRESILQGPMYFDDLLTFDKKKIHVLNRKIDLLNPKDIRQISKKDLVDIGDDNYEQVGKYIVNNGLSEKVPQSVIAVYDRTFRNLLDLQFLSLIDQKKYEAFMNKLEQLPDNATKGINRANLPEIVLSDPLRAAKYLGQVNDANSNRMFYEIVLGQIFDQPFMIDSASPDDKVKWCFFMHQMRNALDKSVRRITPDNLAKMLSDDTIPASRYFLQSKQEGKLTFLSQEQINSIYDYIFERAINTPLDQIKLDNPKELKQLYEKMYKEPFPDLKDFDPKKRSMLKDLIMVAGTATIAASAIYVALNASDIAKKIDDLYPDSPEPIKQFLTKLIQEEPEQELKKLQRPIYSFVYNNAILKLAETDMLISKYEKENLFDCRDFIVNARREQLKAREALIEKEGVSQTSKINTEGRQELRRSIISDLYRNGAKLKNKQLYICLGIPGSGKTTMAKLLNDKYGCLLVDLDSVKEKIPEYKNGKGTIITHSEAFDITNKILDKCKDNGDNILFTISGTYYSELLDHCRKFKEAGYDIHLRYISLPADKAAEREIVEAKKSGKYTEIAFHPLLESTSENTYQRLLERQRSLMKSYAAYSNDVPKGQHPELVDWRSNIEESELE